MEERKNTDFIFRNLDFGWAFNRVIEWNKTARDGKHVFDDSTIALQKKLVKEETDELEDAIDLQDKIESLDALCDMFVVGAYWYFLQNKEMKHGGYLASTPLDSIDYVAAAKFDIENDSSAMFMLAVTSMLLKFDGNIRDALEEVLSSNDSKFPNVENNNGLEGMSVGDEYITPKEMCDWIENVNEGRYTKISYKIVGKGENRRYVFLDSNNKIMKPKGFFKPDLTSFI